MIQPKHILLVRTDSIGDVVLTFPMTGILKEQFPGVKISFLGKTYTGDVIACCKNIDQFLDWTLLSKKSDREKIDFLAKQQIDTVIHVFPRKEIMILCKKSGIKNRIATSHRWFSWITCNHRINFNRKNSNLHESQLNFKLLQPLGIQKTPELNQMLPWLNWKVEKLEHSFLAKGKYNLILHPKSKGSAREWGLENFTRLIQILPEDKFQIYITGTPDEAFLMKDFLEGIETKSNVVNLTGKLSLRELISFIYQSDALLAASTGPLHLAAVSGTLAIGIFPPIRPMHPGRWKPIGKKVSIKVMEKACNDCRKSGLCKCAIMISPESIYQDLMIALSRIPGSEK